MFSLNRECRYRRKSVTDLLNNDKQTEHDRYDCRAKSLLKTEIKVNGTVPILGSLSVPPIYQAPYVYYEHCIRKYIKKNHDVLELGSGTGLHTYSLVLTGARIVASDISCHALEVLSMRLNNRALIKVADMEALPFDDSSFDVVASAGSLSYGNPDIVDKEIMRVLRPGGIFICVDSLNHNPIYRFNRWFHYVSGSRTKSTLLQMPTIERIQAISDRFNTARVQYFGSISYITPFLAFVVGQNYAAKISDAVDHLVKVQQSAFKFVLIACGRL